METSTDIHIESARLQKEIINYLGLNDSELVFGIWFSRRED